MKNKMFTSVCSRRATLLANWWNFRFFSFFTPKFRLSPIQSETHASRVIWVCSVRFSWSTSTAIDILLHSFQMDYVVLSTSAFWGTCDAQKSEQNESTKWKVFCFYFDSSSFEGFRFYFIFEKSTSESSEDVSLLFTPIVRISWLRWLGEICRFTFKRNVSSDKRRARSRWRRMQRWGWRRKVVDVIELNWNNNMLIFYSEKCVAAAVAAVTHFLRCFSSLLLTRFSRLFELSTSVSTFSQFCNLLSLLWSCICFPFSLLCSFFISQLLFVSRSSFVRMFIEFRKMFI